MNSTDPVQTPPTTTVNTDLLQQGVEQLKANNLKANEELAVQLNDLRNGMVAQQQGQPLPGPQPVPNYTAVDDFQYRRTALYTSQWASEVVAAAVLDEAFKNEVGEKAKVILREKGLLPALPTDSSTETTGG